MSGAKNIAILLGILVVFLLVVAPVSATVVTYDPTGSAGTIQDVINNASSGDSIFLPAGTYYGNFVIDRSIVFGGLDTNNPPIIISDGSSAGITLAADGITINGVVIGGNASSGLQVLSGNNRISSTTVRGHEFGLGLNSASNNIFAENTLVGNSIGINIDRSSRSNTFFLNTFNNTIEVVSPSAQNTWTSSRLDYQYNGQSFSGPLGNYWEGTTVTDSNGDGIGDTAFSPTPTQGAVHGAADVTDSAPLVSPPSAYMIIKSASPVNTTRLGDLMRPTGVPSSLQPDNPQDSLNPGASSSPAGGSPSGMTPQVQGQPPNPFVGVLIQYWWLIPVAILISAVGGIWFERSRRKRAPDTPPAARLTADARNATVVKNHPEGVSSRQPEYEYGVRLPAALEKKYPDAEYIAEGGVSRVFRVHDEKNNRDIAVKVPIRFDEVTGSQFTKELNVWEGLHHKNIVEIYAANIFPRPYIEMEYVESSLEGQHFPLDEKKAVAIITGVAEGLRYAHEQGIVHRDIKPGNIMIAPDGTAKITDWGLSKAEGTKQSGLIGFSLEYAAPEQLAPNLYGEPGPWTDIYQMGVLFYEMLTGHVPFAGDGMGEITHAILHEEPVPALSGGAHADAINAIITKCIMKRPQDRYASVADLLSDLNNLDLTK
ncbi:protein kinase [Methanoregula sp.]|uniref:protein kinase domain-containing protein n=1 Tax=Methanoregula sp. TaxID=2052170 RepID=UPI0035633F7E